ncbi:transporter substrate-binding domain-containing protein [Oxalobacteraceae bacterium]|nr:transporter substrate-binding domain-containing protein [Oxalobacteraceae bacterium]
MVLNGVTGPARRGHPRWRTLALGAALGLALLRPAAPLAAADTADVTIFTDDAYPPYSYAVDGQARGVYPAILRAGFARMPGYRVQMQPVPWKRGLKALEQGETLALVPPYFRPDERPYMAYSQPILAESVVLFCTDSAMPRGRSRRWPEDFFGLRIGMNSGFLAGGPEFEKALKLGRLTLAEARGTTENVKKLLLGRIDCYANDRFSILQALAQVRSESAFRHGENVSEAAVISQENGFLGYTRSDKGRFPFKDDFIQQFNAALAELKRSGEIEQIVNRELGR